MNWHLLKLLGEVIAAIYIIIGFVISCIQWNRYTKYLAEPYALFIFTWICWPLMYIGNE